MASRISSIILNNPSGFLDSFVSTMGFKFVEFFIKLITGKSQKMSNNFTALFHASGISILGLYHIFICPNDENLRYIITKFSTGYFLYDSINTIKNMKGKLKYPFVYHHIISAYYMHVEPSIIAVKGLTTAELSNIPSYWVYYFLKTKNPNVKLWKKIQFIIYSFIRVPILGYYTYTAYKEAQNKLPISLMIPVYIMGLIWTKSLYKQL